VARNHRTEGGITATDFTAIPDWRGSQTEGAGVAVADVDGDGRPDLVVLMVDGAAGRNAASYRVGRALDADGAVSGGWSEWMEVPGWRFRQHADVGIVLADLDGDGRPELIVFAIDAQSGGDAAYYRIGRKLDVDGAVSGWGAWQAITDWISTENQRGDIAVADLDGDGRPELIVVVVDRRAGGDGGYFRVGRKLDSAGTVTGGWSEWAAIPDWFSSEDQGVGAAVADLDGDGRPELVVFRVGSRDGRSHGSVTVGWGVDVTGRASVGWGPWTEIPDWRLHESRGAAAAFAEVDDGARPELVTLTIAEPAGRSTGFHRSSALALDVDTAAERGVWRLLDFDSQILAIHAALLHTGDVLFFSGSGNDRDDHEAHRFRTRVWHYPSARFSAPRTPIDLFCAGQSFLSGGRLLVAGGTGRYAPFRGIRDALAFDPSTLKWVRVRRMARPRWYPTLLTLGDGRVISVSGRGADGALDRVPEVFESGRGWRNLRSPGLLPWYAHLFLLDDGRVFYSGGQMSGNRGAKPMLWEISSGDTTTVPGLPKAALRNQSASVLLPPAQEQRVMIVGGGGADLHEHADDEPEAQALPEVAVDSVAIVDLSRASPRYARTARLRQARMHLNATLLPDRTVLANGGAAVEEHKVEAALNAEIYDPRSRTWRLAAKSRVPRLYHSIALLTPDGKVVTAGSNPRPKDDELRIEVFSPPYLFRGRRPRCTLSADHAAHGDRLSATSPDAARLREVNLVRAGATTHAFNNDQRLVDVPFEVTGPDRIELRLPRSRRLAPPGWYMVFLVDTDGVPSVGRWLRLA
jgi:hypothetical protein